MVPRCFALKTRISRPGTVTVLSFPPFSAIRQSGRNAERRSSARISGSVGEVASVGDLLIFRFDLSQGRLPVRITRGKQRDLATEGRAKRHRAPARHRALERFLPCIVLGAFARHELVADIRGAKFCSTAQGRSGKIGASPLRSVAL